MFVLHCETWLAEKNEGEDYILNNYKSNITKGTKILALVSFETQKETLITMK
jgi:hypothetical protein